MGFETVNRRAFCGGAGLFAAGLGVFGAGGAASKDVPMTDGAHLGISNSSAAIHQEAVFNATADRVYHALTDAAQFSQVVIFSGAIQSMQLANAPTMLSAEPGSAFSLFGGYITGRQIELTPNTRIIQAWHAGSWAPHIYSITRFELEDRGDHTRLVFDQTGFPNDEASSLAHGWREHYWKPLAKLLG